MIKQLLLLLVFCSLKLQAETNFEEQIDMCKGNTEPIFCISKVLLNAMREFIKPPSGGNIEPRCKCKCGSYSSASCNLNYFDEEKTIILADGINPNACLEALRFPPCRN